MVKMNRRSALTLALAAASAVAASEKAIAQRSTTSAGKEIAPGVKQVDLGKGASMLPAYKSVAMHDFVYQPKAKTVNPSMISDMVCHCAQGSLRVKPGDGAEFVAKPGDVWSCNKGQPETVENIARGVSIMRVINLLPG